MLSYATYVTPVILCGGRGKRLWPFSCLSKPKQFIKFPGMQYTLLQSTLMRLVHQPLFNAPIIIVLEDFLELLQDQLRELDIKIGHIIVEPNSNGTAAAATLAAFKMQQKKETRDSLMLIIPIDHHLENENVLFDRIHGVAPLIQDEIAIFGVSPTRPEPHYGYLKIYPDEYRPGLHKIHSFLEKPDADIINQLSEKGHCYWNMGIFLCKVGSFLGHMHRFMPDVYNNSILAIQNSVEVDIKIFTLAFDLYAKISIDAAVVARSDKIVASIVDVKWHDLGHLHTAWEISVKDEYGNFSGADDILMDTRNSYVFGQSKPTIVIGLDDIFVINSDAALLIANRKNIADVAEIYSLPLKQTDLTHQTQTSWGHYSIFEKKAAYFIRKLYIKPLHRAALQLHKNIDIHITVASGIACFIMGNALRVLHAGEVMHIAKNCVYRIMNEESDVPLVLVEVRIVEDMIHDDLVMIQNDYGYMQD